MFFSARRSAAGAWCDTMMTIWILMFCCLLRFAHVKWITGKQMLVFLTVHRHLFKFFPVLIRSNFHRRLRSHLECERAASSYRAHGCFTIQGLSVVVKDNYWSTPRQTWKWIGFHTLDGFEVTSERGSKNSFLFEALSEICCRGLTSLLSRPHSCVNNAGQWAILKSQYNGLLGYKSLNIPNDTYRTTDTAFCNMNTQILIHEQVWVQFCEYFWLTNQQIWFIRVICSLIGQHSCTVIIIAYWKSL